MVFKIERKRKVEKLNKEREVFLVLSPFDFELFIAK